MNKLLPYLFLLLLSNIPKVSIAQDILFEFTNKTELSNWKVVNDDVMGGISSSRLSVISDGKGEFSGNISLENNGGFASIRYNCGKIKLKNKTKITLRIKGDKKTYQLRIKAKKNDYFSYIFPFETKGMWENISINLSDMYPSFRGRRLNMNNYNENSIEEITFLIGNSKNQKFKFIIDSIILE